MNKVFISNLVLVVTLNVIIKPLYIFGIDRGVQNAVGASEYGLYFALFNFAYLFQIINDLGLQNYNHSVLSKYQQIIPKYLPKILTVKLVLACFFVIITILSSVLIGFSVFLWPLLILILLNQILISFLQYLRTTMSALGHYHLDSILSVSDKLLMIAWMGYLLWFSEAEISIMGFVIAQTFTLAFSLLIAVGFIWRYIGKVNYAWQFDPSFSLTLFKKSAPYALVLLLMTLYTRMDAVMLERLLSDGKEEAGIYAASYRILDAFSNVGLLFAGLLLPMFAKLIGRQESVSDLVRIARNLLLTFSITIISISLVYSGPIMTLLYDHATAYWAHVFRLLIISYVGIALGYIYGTLLTANESIRMMNYIFLVGVGLNFTLNLILIPYWKAWGAAMATVVTQISVAIALLILAYRYLRMPIDGGAWLRIGIFTISVYLLAHWSQVWNLSWWYASVVIGILAVSIALILRLINLRDWLPFRL
ncbi:MAG: oligosaccharide flippase family protein [Saprospiraceae bacterium]|nr:oligosaccharide flippase family protein [Saprospiraceae bacterium]